MARIHRVRLKSGAVQLLAAACLAVLAPPVALLAQQGPPAVERVWNSDNDADGQELAWSDQVPAYVSVVDGSATLRRDGRLESAQENTPLISGDRVHTGRGRALVLLGDGGSLALDEESAVGFIDETLMRLDAGRITFTVARTPQAVSYRVDAAGTSIWIRAAGVYRITIDDRPSDPTVHLLVKRGAAEVASPVGRTFVRAGYEVTASAGTPPTSPYPVTVAAFDGFDAWLARHEDERLGLATSTYLPDELASYDGVFARHGAWQYESAYGYVWYPQVGVNWRPYSSGRWSFVGSFGWTWIGDDRWSWPTHHYGRWGLNGARWYWIPARHWAPAWVSWASAPGYVGWCPLGFDNRPLFSASVGFTNGWRGWNVAQARAFSSPVVVASRAVIVPAGPVVHFTERRTQPGRPVAWQGNGLARTAGAAGLERPAPAQPSARARARDGSSSAADRGPLLTNRPAPPAEGLNTPARGRLAGPVINWPNEPSRAANPVVPGRDVVERPSPRVVAPFDPREAGRTPGPARTRVAPSAPAPSESRPDAAASREARAPRRAQRDAVPSSAPEQSSSAERGPTPPRGVRSAPSRASDPSPQGPTPATSGSPAARSSAGRAQPRGR